MFSLLRRVPLPLLRPSANFVQLKRLPNRVFRFLSDSHPLPTGKRLFSPAFVHLKIWKLLRKFYGRLISLPPGIKTGSEERYSTGRVRGRTPYSSSFDLKMKWVHGVAPRHSGRVQLVRMKIWFGRMNIYIYLFPGSSRKNCCVQWNSLSKNIFPIFTQLRKRCWKYCNISRAVIEIHSL